MTTPDLTSYSVRLLHTVPAFPERVFAAFTEPEQLMQWWGPPGFCAPSAEVDLRVGGAYRLEMQTPDGDHFFVKGTFRNMVPPSKVAMTWEWENTSMDGEVSMVEIDFRRNGDGTEIELLHEGFPCEETSTRHQVGWESCLLSLREMLVQ